MFSFMLILNPGAPKKHDEVHLPYLNTHVHKHHNIRTMTILQNEFSSWHGIMHGITS